MGSIVSLTEGPISDAIRREIESEYGWLEEEVASIHGPFELTAAVLRNNLANVFLTIGVGIGFGILTLSMFAINAITIGYVGTLATHSSFQNVFFLFPHGPIELAAYVLAVTCGVRLGIGSIRSVLDRMVGPLREAGSDVGDLLPGVVLLLVVSGFIEGFLTPLTGPFLNYLKVTLGFLLFFVVLLWFKGDLVRP